MLPTNVTDFSEISLELRFSELVCWWEFDLSIKATRGLQQQKECSGISPAFIRNRDFHLVEARKLCDLPKTFGWMVETCKVGPEKPVVSQGFKSQHTSHHSYQNRVVDVRKKSMAPCTRWASNS